MPLSREEVNAIIKVLESLVEKKTENKIEDNVADIDIKGKVATEPVNSTLLVPTEHVIGKLSGDLVLKNIKFDIHN